MVQIHSPRPFFQVDELIGEAEALAPDFAPGDPGQNPRKMRISGRAARETHTSKLSTFRPAQLPDLGHTTFDPAGGASMPVTG